MLKRTSFILAAAIFALGAVSTGAMADNCSGRSHPTGSILGAVGGGLIGSAITHGSAVGVVGGAVAGGLAGNAVERSRDCGRRTYRSSDRRHYYYDRDHRRHYTD